MHDFIEHKLHKDFFKDKKYDDDLLSIRFHAKNDDAWDFSNYSRYEICSKCNLELFYYGFSNSGADDKNYTYIVFAFNGKEIYDDYVELEDIEISCEEFLIKNILE